MRTVGMMATKTASQILRSRNLCAALGAALLVTACATKSPPPTEEMRKEALGKVDADHPWKAVSASAEPVRDDWLSTFQDPELNQLVREAIANNPDLRVAAARVEQAQQYLVQAQAALKPTLGLAGTGGFKSGGGSDVSSALQGILLAASWELDLWGRLRYARNAAREMSASAQADFEFGRQSIAANTAKAWFAATLTTLRASIASEMVRASQQLQTLALERERVGAGTTTESAISRAVVHNYQDAEQQALFAQGQALRALELLVGRYPGAEIKARAELGAMPGPIPVGLPLQMLDRRPDVIAAERRVAAAFHRVGEAKAAFFPKISLNASVGAFSSEILQLKSDYENPTAGVGGRFFVPLYQGGALNAQLQIRTLEQKEAVADYARIALRALADVENALAASQTLGTRVGFLNEALTEQARALDFTQQNLRVGRTDQRAVEQQRLDTSNARIAFLTARSDELAARVNLHLALGGSFEIPERQANATP